MSGGGGVLVGLLALTVGVQMGAPAAAQDGGQEPPGGSVRVASEQAAGPRSGRTRRERRAASSASLEELWREAVAARREGNLEEAGRRLKEIRRLRTERNVASHEIIGLGLVARGVEQLDAEDVEEAETVFSRAVDLAPGLPDGHYGVSVARLKKGALWVVPSLQAMTAGLVAFLPTARGTVRATELLITTGLLAILLIGWAVSVALLIRHGGLLRHDLEEWLGPTQSRAASLALCLLVLLFPLAAFQGWGWLALWWLAVLFSYFSGREKAVAVLLAASVVTVGPALAILERQVVTTRNPLYAAAMEAVEGQPDDRQAALLEAALRSDPDDRDLAYLLGAAWRRSGRVDDAATLYRGLLQIDPTDAVARNNLANIEFAGGDYDAALIRYRQGAESRESPRVTATLLYNLSLAHLEKFEYQAYNEAKSSADRLDRSLVASYDRWRFDSGDYGVVDLGLSREEVWRKFAGVDVGVGKRNVMGTAPEGRLRVSPMAFVNRFTGAALLFVAVAFVISRLRGRSAFTVHCSRCGTAFCNQCHLGRAVGDLCSQCYHLFVVRDGVSGPVRNRKMLEVQGRETRRARIFRVLSVLSPGAGHVYSRQTVTGVLLLGVWYTMVALLLASRFVAFTEVSSRLTPPWVGILIGTLMLLSWVLANRIRPEFDVLLPKQRKARRPRASQGA